MGSGRFSLGDTKRVTSSSLERESDRARIAGIFAEFLKVTELFAHWMEGCPMLYTRPNAPAKTDVSGIWLRSIFDGSDVIRTSPSCTVIKSHRRYSMNKIVSEETRLSPSLFLAQKHATRANAPHLSGRAHRNALVCPTERHHFGDVLLVR